MSLENQDATVGPAIETEKLPSVLTQYSGYEPPFDLEPVVMRLLQSVPSKYLKGLGEVILTNSAGLSRQRRRSVTKSRKHKVRVSRALGLYHPAWHNRPPWIEIFVDNVLEPWKRGLWLKVRIVREPLIGDVLFHEIGHHIHFSLRPEFREREDVADVWKVRLRRRYLQKRYPLLRFLFRYVLRPFRPLFRALARRRDEADVKRGWISRAEFDEYWSEDQAEKHERRGGRRIE